jgi:hypothetical protein
MVLTTLFVYGPNLSLGLAITQGFAGRELAGGRWGTWMQVVRKFLVYWLQGGQCRTLAVPAGKDPCTPYDRLGGL